MGGPGRYTGAARAKERSAFQGTGYAQGQPKAIDAVVGRQAHRKITSYWVDELNGKGIPSGDILSLEAALSSEQVKHRGVIEEVTEPEIGISSYST